MRCGSRARGHQGMAFAQQRYHKGRIHIHPLPRPPPPPPPPEQIVVSPGRYEELRLLGLEEHFSANPAEGHYVHVVPKRDVNPNRLRQYAVQNGCYVIGIIPTAYHALRDHHKAGDVARTAAEDDYIPFVCCLPHFP